MESSAPAPASQDLMNEAVVTVVALAAAAASNNCPAYETHLKRALEQGIPKEDLIHATNIALRIKQMPHKELVDLAQACLLSHDCEDGDCGSCGGGCGCGE